jgi:hypothetical protein
MRKFFVLFILAFVLFAIIGCTISSQYLLTGEYINPKTNIIEHIEIPVSQYEYDKTNVGDTYEVRMHTILFGFKIPLNDSNPPASIAMIDMLPIVALCLVIGFTIYMIYKQDFISWGNIITFILSLGFIAFLVLTTQPDFTVTSTIIDKTFQIISR